MASEVFRHRHYDWRRQGIIESFVSGPGLPNDGGTGSERENRRFDIGAQTDVVMDSAFSLC